MAVYNDIIGGLATGTGVPSGFTARFVTSGVVYAVSSDASAPNGKKLNIDRSTTARSLLGYDGVNADGDRGDIDQLIMFRSNYGTGTTNTTWGGLMCRADGIAGEEEAHAGVIGWEGTSGGNRRIRHTVYRFPTGSFSTVSSTPSTWAVSTLYWLRSTVRGTTATLTLYADDSGRPGSVIDSFSITPDSANSTDWAGLFSFASTTNIDVLYYSIGTGTDDAPPPAFIDAAEETNAANAITAPAVVNVAAETNTANSIEPIEVTALINKFDAGNASSSLSSITDANTLTPTVWIDARPTATPDGWSSMTWALSGVGGGKTVTIQINRASMYLRGTSPATNWLPQWTTDYNVPDPVWTQAASRTLVGGSIGYIECTFTGLPSGTVYFSTHPTKPNAYADLFATELLTDYSSVATPTASADSGGVYNVSPAETDEDAIAIGGNNQYSIKLAFGGSTTDGGPKRKLVMTAGIHAAGEHYNWNGFEAAIRWILDDASTEAANVRANWDVYLYFNLTPNGLTGGHARTNFRSSKDPNRDWVDHDLVEIGATADAIILDTGGAADAFISFHGWPEKTTSYFVAGNAQTAAAQVFIANLNTISGVTAEEGNSTLIDADFGWAQANLSPTMSVACEVGLRGNTSLANVRTVAENWMKALEATDADGVFYAGTVPQGATTISAVDPDVTTAVVTYSYDDDDAAGFEYRLDGGAWAAIGASPATITGLTAETTYEIEVRAVNSIGAGTASTPFEFTTDAAPTATLGVSVSLYDGATEQASLSNIRAFWADSSPPTGNATLVSTTETTDSSGVLVLDLTGFTSQDIGDAGTLFLYQYDVADEKDSLAWTGRLVIEDIS